MKLSELIKGMDVTEMRAGPDTELTGVTSDSRKVQPGFAFIAVRGYESDGHRYIDKALAAGASVVIAEEAGEDVPAVIMADTRLAMAIAAANWYGRPADSLKMIGVTGTNGKTTTTNLIKHILESALGVKAGLIGTNRNMIGDTELPAERTTPDCFELQALLRRMVDEGCEYAVMEVSSHALYLDRVYGIRFTQGLFLNLTEDHLDFHKTMENYARAKAILFKMCDTAIVNMDDPWYKTVLEGSDCPVFTFSARRDDADLTARNIKLRPDHISFCALTTGKLEKLRLGIPGMFSVYNALAATASALVAGIPLEAVRPALAECGTVKGRAEIVPTGTDYTVLIDYAHTPDALENILNTVSDYAENRTVLLFGCGGDRDAAKRPIMGSIAVELADYVIITSDNPRTEEPEAIINDILKGIDPDTDTPYDVICDRREAIYRALSIARPGDVVILAGKGHETYQEIDRVKHHFDEREVVAQALERIRRGE